MTSKKKIFVSSGAFKTNSLKEILEACALFGIVNLELSSAIEFTYELKKKLFQHLETHGLQYLVHNYFPPSKKPLVINLASDNKAILKASRNHCKQALDLCNQLNVPFYSFHAGFCFHAEPEHLGKCHVRLPRIRPEKSQAIFIESLQILSEYAQKYNINLAIENNVVTAFDLVDGKNSLLLGTRSDELLEILESVAAKNLYLLLDMGHLKISAKSLGFDPVEFIKITAPHTIEVHLSENDGASDTNKRITSKSWFWTPLQKYLARSTYYVLEAYNLHPEEISDQLKLIEKKMGAYA